MTRTGSTGCEAAGIDRVCLLIVTLCAPGVALAQEGSPKRGEVAVEILKVHFSEGSDADMARLDDAHLSTIVTVTARYRLGERLDLLAELPFSHLSGKANSCVDAVCMKSLSSTVLNNPYVGLGWNTPIKGVALTAGFRPGLQTASWLGGDGGWRERWGGHSTEMGVYGDDVDRLEAYLPDVSSGTVGVSFRAQATPPLVVGAFARYITMYHPTAEGYIHDRDGKKYKQHVHYGADFDLSVEAWSIGGGVHARRYPSASPTPARVHYQVAASLTRAFRTLRVGTEFRRPFGHEYSRLRVGRSFQIHVHVDL